MYKEAISVEELREKIRCILEIDTNASLSTNSRCSVIRVQHDEPQGREVGENAGQKLERNLMVKKIEKNNRAILYGVENFFFFTEV